MFYKINDEQILVGRLLVACSINFPASIQIS